MLIVRVCNEIVNKDNKLIGYTISTGCNGSEQIKDVKREQLEQFIKEGKCICENMELDNGRLVYKSAVQDKDSRITEMKELIDKINNATLVYEQGKDEVLSNNEWDKLYDRLKYLEDNTGIILEDSPTQHVGYEVVSELTKEKHSVPMLSLNKTKETGTLKEFLGDKTGIMSWKLDGITIVLTYNNGKLLKAVTRGNGEVGEVVTNNARTFKNLPLNIGFKGKLVLRGEALISYSNFNRINERLAAGERYKNPRNLCSGSVRQLDSNVTAKRNVIINIFTLVESDGLEFESVKQQLEWVKGLGFDVVENVEVSYSNIDDTIHYFSNKIKTYDLPSDGLVLTYDDIKYGKSLGVTSKFPRHSIAFKWKDEEAITKLKEIEWSPSRTGLINPIAVFDPVELEGTTVSRASIHNISILESLELGYGDRIKVYKANMIIPQVKDNLDRTNTVEIPDVCPVCGKETIINIEESSGVKTLYCTNNMCMAKGIRGLSHFVSRDAMNIDGISKATLDRFVGEGYIEKCSDIYNLDRYMADIISLDGFGEKSYNKIISAIDSSRKVKLSNLIYALGIPNVGLSTAKLICNSIGGDVDDVVNATYTQLISIDGIGETIAYSFENYFNDSENMDNFNELIEELEIQPESDVEDSSMQGLTFCVTGAVYRFSNRRQVKNIIESHGGKLTGSVSKSTDYLVTNDTGSGSSKNKKAAEYGIDILTEDEFIEKFSINLG